MTKKLQKMAVAAAAILGLGATSVKSAEAASVKLTFFEYANTPVGVGSLSYDESTPYEAIFPSLEIKPSNKWFVVKDFAVNLLGESWNLSQATSDPRGGLTLSPLLWAPYDPGHLKVVKISGSRQATVWETWSFGTISRHSPTPTSPVMHILGNIGGPGFRMYWAQNGSRSDGSFGFNEGYVIPEEVGPGGENPEPVPEPATTAGLALAAAGLGYAKKKFGASKV